MDRYQRVEKPKEEKPINENEIRITSQGRIRSYITYATGLFEEKGSNEIVFKAMGRAINKAVMIAELMKRRIVDLHQITATGSADITDTWEPLEEGLLPLETVRHVSMITITLSKNEVDVSSVGYQAPIPKDQVKPLAEFDYGGEGPIATRGRGRGVRGRGMARAMPERTGNDGPPPMDYGEGGWDNEEHGYGRGGWGRSFRGRGRGRGGYGVRFDYQQEAGHFNDEPPYPIQGRGRGRGRFNYQRETGHANEEVPYPVQGRGRGRGRFDYQREAYVNDEAPYPVQGRGRGRGRFNYQRDTETGYVNDEAQYPVQGRGRGRGRFNHQRDTETGYVNDEAQYPVQGRGRGRGRFDYQQETGHVYDEAPYPGRGRGRGRGLARGRGRGRFNGPIDEGTGGM